MTEIIFKPKALYISSSYLLSLESDNTSKEALKYTMTSNYNLPILPQYLFDNYSYEYQKSVAKSFPVEIVKENLPSCRPLEYQTSLEDKIFKRPPYKDKDSCDFISSNIDVQDEQLKILLDQIKARHQISYNVRSSLLEKEMILSAKLNHMERGYNSLSYSLRDRAKLEQNLDGIRKEQNMEYVSLWRDTQKALLDIFKQWQTHANLKRRSEVIGSDF